MQSPTAFLCLWCTCFVGVLSVCDISWPVCHFAENFTCGWTRSEGWRLYRFHKEAFNTNYYLGLNNNTHNVKERFESETVCPTGNRVYCLHFRYRFEDNDVLNLSVVVKLSDEDERVVWRVSNSTNSSAWDDAQVLVEADSEFSVVFDATGPTDGRVDIDSIDYEDIRTCDTQPPSASPPPTPASGTARLLQSTGCLMAALPLSLLGALGFL